MPEAQRKAWAREELGWGSSEADELRSLRSMLSSGPPSARPAAAQLSAAASEGRCDIFFSLRLAEAKPQADAIKAAIERRRPGLSCFVSGGNPNAADIALIISRALAESKLAVIMGSKTYGQKTASNFSTFQEMQYILSKKGESQRYLLKMCDEWEEPQTELMLVGLKYRQWEGRVTDDLVKEILAQYDSA